VPHTLASLTRGLFAVLGRHPFRDEDALGWILEGDTRETDFISIGQYAKQLATAVWTRGYNTGQYNKARLQHWPVQQGTVTTLASTTRHGCNTGRYKKARLQHNDWEDIKMSVA
jgi:hypothetical protein